MKREVDNTNQYLTWLAASLSAIAAALWVVPQKFDDEMYTYNELLTAPFNGLTNFEAYIQGDNVGRMPSFIALAFFAILLLQVRRR